MRIVFYDAENRIVDIVKNVENPTIEGNNIQWETGGINGANLPFLILDDSVQVDGLTADELVPADQKNKFTKQKIDLATENEDLKKQIQDISKDFQDFMDFFFSQ